MAKRLTALTRAVANLRTCFLPNPFDPLGVYPEADCVQMRTRAFLVLSHAEIETYLEEWGKDISKAAERVWTKSQRVSAPLAFLVGSIGDRVKEIESLSGKASIKDSPQRFGDNVVKVFQLYYRRVNENNGIKEKNVLRLFDPIGIAAAAFAPTLLPNLDTLGRVRGEHAHYSAKAVTTVLDPESEYDRVQTIITDLAPLETWLTKYRRAIR